MDTFHGLTGYLYCATEKGKKATGLLQLHQSPFSDSEIFLAGKGTEPSGRLPDRCDEEAQQLFLPGKYSS